MNENVAWLRGETAALRRQLTAHSIYNRIETVRQLHVFLEDHVFAVWDFMSLLKALQRKLTCVEIPWQPTTYPVSRRLINEIVLGEESDEDLSGGYISHFELYRRAMLECGANVGPIDCFLTLVESGTDVAAALREASRNARRFVKATFDAIESDKPHVIAAAFTFGREDVIPDMFRALVAQWSERMPEQFRSFQYYLERHIDLDEHTHAPMALRMMEELCGEDSLKWQEAKEAVAVAIGARISLWDGVTASLETL